MVTRIRIEGGARDGGALRSSGGARDGDALRSSRPDRPWALVRLRAAAALGLAGVSTACFSYVPARPEGLGGGMQAQVRLTLDGTRDLERSLGPEVRVVRGVVESAAADSVVLLVRELQLIDGQTMPQTGTRVTLRRSQMADVERRVASKAKTVVAVGVAVGAAVLVYVAARPRGSQGEVTGPGGPPPAAVVP